MRSKAKVTSTDYPFQDYATYYLYTDDEGLKAGDATGMLKIGTNIIGVGTVDLSEKDSTALLTWLTSKGIELRAGVTVARTGTTTISVIV